MKKIKYTEEQIVGILKEVEAGFTVSEICRKYGISDATYYNWKAKYGGMAASDIKRLRQLEDEKLAEKRRRSGCQMLHLMLKREGLVINHKRTERIYREERLAVRIRRRKKLEQKWVTADVL